MDPAMAALDVLAAPPPWLVSAADGDRVAAALRREVPELGSGSRQVVGCRVEDLRLKGRQWAGRYELAVDDGTAGRRWVPVDGVLDPHAPLRTPSALRAALGDPRWAVDLADPPLALTAAGRDRKLPALGLLTDASTALRWLEVHLAAAYPGIRIDSCRPVVARYRPGQRCIVICQLRYAAPRDPDWPTVVVVKIYREGRGAHEYRALQAIAAAGWAGSGRLRFAEPLAYVPEDDVAVQSHLPQDRSLVTLLEQAAAGAGARQHAADALASVAAALATLHRSPVRYGKRTAIADEVASVRAGARRLESLAAELPTAVEPLLELIEARAREIPADPDAPAHGAFRPAQVRLDGSQVGLLDLDGFGSCEPAQDVGRFLAKLRLVVLSAAPDRAGLAARLELADELAAAFLDRYIEQAPASPLRIPLWETLDLLKALLQSWSRARPTQAAPALRLLTDRVDLLR